MKFQIKDLKKLLYSVRKNQINEINITSKKFGLTINKVQTKERKTNIRSKSIIERKEKTNKNTKINQENLYNQTISNHNNDTDNYSIIVSPMVGTFYRSPAPNEPTFVELYDIVERKQIVCIIEAMKLMNEIEAEVSGKIVEILVQDGDIIDCGQALMRVKPIIP